MIFDTSVALNWILFLALFPMLYFWVKDAWAIVVRGDFSGVALKRGVSPRNPARFAPIVAGINIIAALVAFTVIVGVVLAKMDYGTWTAVAGSTLWLKIFAGFIVSRHAHAV